MTLPIALTCGEPAGVGLEISEKAWSEIGQDVPFFLIADPRHLAGTVPHVLISDPSEATSAMAHGMPVLAHKFAQKSSFGTPAAENACGVIEVIERAVSLVQDGRASAVCTNPIHKKALKDGAGFAFPGHTEFLADLAGVERVVMMLASDELRVVPVTIHIALADVATQLTPELLRETLSITQAGLRRDFGLPSPRIAVAGVNPHAGEGGAMGTEELNWINGLVADMAEGGMNIRGPLPADTMFHARARKTYDVAVCMYHDQALIPIKTLDFDRGVNVTLGLPFVRTSPDHGTAFDIAGKGVANPTSLIEALKLAQKMAAARQSENKDA